ncbi:MAG: ATP-binding protein [Chloroflexota bacterium]
MEELKTNLSLQADVARIQNASERAAALTRQLLAFSRQQVLEPQILNLNDTILQIETMLHRVMAENIVLVTKFEPSLSPIQVDPSQLDQVILNLVVNACDAMPRGGRLEIETQNVHLEACSLGPDAPKQAGAYVQLSVSDTGVGIDSALQPLIFDPFFTTKSQDQGSGLGLAVVHGIIQQSGGFICLDSEPAKGTTFKLYFPQIDALPENGQHPTASWTSLIGTEMILLVEDSEMIRHIVCQVLERYGYTVLVADSSQVALQFAKNHSYTIDLLLTDVVLSDEVSGPQLANQLQAIQPALPVLYMSGHTCDVTRNHDLLDPEAPFLQKPFTASTLVHHIRAVLDHPTQKP